MKCFTATRGEYGLVSLRGAWISGGMEFNFPNGHTVVTVSPVAFTTLQNSDGSATVVVGDVDLVTEMHWEVALTLRPGQARLEQHVTLFNDTGLTNPYWYWANTAVPATDDMRFIYPMREANPHSHEEIWSFPMHDGVDYSWYKNVRHPTSLFGRQVHRNFFGAYYEKSDYGVVHVADFQEVVGKKTWTWGVGDDGLIWTGLLTDHDGPYNEIQAGRFETQLNYEFMPPRRADSFTEFWYPLRAGGRICGSHAASGAECKLFQGCGGDAAACGVLPVSHGGDCGRACAREAGDTGFERLWPGGARAHDDGESGSAGGGLGSGQKQNRNHRHRDKRPGFAALVGGGSDRWQP